MAASTFLTLFALLQGCGGGAGSAPTTQAGDLPPAEEKGELIITITDAPGDFLRYVVDVPQLTLYRANGDVVETLPFNTRIDFAELTEVSEFLTIASVPAGVYESVVLTLDYSGAESSYRMSLATNSWHPPLMQTAIRSVNSMSNSISRPAIQSESRPAALLLSVSISTSTHLMKLISQPVRRM
jgi:hypothetical protein